MGPFISRDEIKTLVASGSKHTIVEALPKRYYDAEHLPGAINIPHDAVPATVASLIPDKDAAVIVYCANAECRNSHTAAEAMRGLGYRHVYEYTEGKKGWKDAGLPLESAGGTK